MKNDGIKVVRPRTFYPINRRLQILVIKLDDLGDFVVAIPALTRLREKFKVADIDIVIGEWNADLANELKYFRNIYFYDLFRDKFATGLKRSEVEEERLLAKLSQYDIAIDLRRHGDTRFLLSRIPARLRVGYRSFSPYDRELDVCFETEIEESGIIKASDECHMSVQLVRLVDSIPAGFIDLPKLRKWDPAGAQLAIFPKAGNAAREWPLEYFLELCQRVVDEEIADTLNIYLPMGQSKILHQFNQIQNLKVHIGLSMKDLLNSLIKNRLAISNNSFGGHMGSYLGIPTIAIYSGHEFVEQWGPAFGNTTVIFSKVSCAPCHKRLIPDCPYDTICLKQIKPHHVLEMVKKEMEKDKFNNNQAEWRTCFVY